LIEETLDRNEGRERRKEEEPNNRDPTGGQDIGFEPYGCVIMRFFAWLISQRTVGSVQSAYYNCVVCEAK